MSIMKRDGHPKEQPPLRRTQARRLTASIPLIYSIARVPRGQFNYWQQTYDAPTSRLTDEVYQGISRNLIIKTSNICIIKLIKRATLSIESVTLKAPEKLLYCSTTPYTITRRWCKVSTNANIKSHTSITTLIFP